MTEAFAAKNIKGDIVQLYMTKPASVPFPLTCIPVQVTEGWIPVSERLPTEQDADGLGDVLQFYFECKASHKVHWLTVCRMENEEDKLPGHVWMPLPPPPKEPK